MDNSVSSWFSELGMEDPFLNEQYVMMDFMDDEFCGLGEDLQGWLSPAEGNTCTTPSPITLIPRSSSTTSLSVLSAMEAPPLAPLIETPPKQLRTNNSNNGPAASTFQHMQNNHNHPSVNSSSPMVLTFGNPAIFPHEIINRQQVTLLGNLSPPDQDDAVSEVLTPQGSFLNLEEAAKLCAQKPKKSGGRVRPPSQTYDHIIAERKRREQLSQRFVALSAIVPGLKKMDKTSVLGDAINYLKHLQERVKTLEEQAAKQTMESVVLVKRSHVSLVEDEGSSDEMGGSAEEQPLPEIEAKVCNNNVLLRVHCEKQKGVLVKLLSEIENFNLAVVSTSVAPFGSLALDVTIIALMETGFSLTMQELVKSLRLALRQVDAQAD